MKNLKGKHLVWLHDWSKEEIETVLDTALKMKSDFYAGIQPRPLAGKTLAMIFSKPSTRTRVSFEVAMTQLGGHAIYLGMNDLQIGRGETIADTARVISRYCDGIMIRTFHQSDVETLAKYSRVPVINGLTDLVHPCQALADLMTLREKFGRLSGLTLAYVGDGNNVCHSLMIGGAKMGMEIRAVTPPGYEPKPEITRLSQEHAEKHGGKIVITNDIDQGVKGADVIYTDVWTSMGQEKEREERLKVMRPYQVNGALMTKAGDKALFMHCLPAHRGEEVTDEVADGPQSIIFDQAENRLHVQKALLALVM
ncbi:MAG: ornithine carbamoyltransferase [Candidatus Fermentithermobacillus carboniphilus]|uniref:Ornithine carbamoyltransferase n=1 Tax=Candidatus Fermentithermobacillus carboniphilus TaxID=3085328 RepID=A0AAT9LA49_9FIRM|nr:MAG: ornithine carbamoyltransferase [Candidatus Fermentithermobacillus carboniphilus]